MADINTLLGLGVQPQDNMEALADKLRGQQRAGQFFGLSQIEPISNLGKSMATGAVDSAQRGGVLRQSMEKEAARKEELKAEKARLQENYQATALAKTMAADVANRNKIDATSLANTNKIDATALANTNKVTAKALADSINFEDFEDYVDAEGNRTQIAQKAGEVFKLDENGDIERTTLEGQTPYADPNKGRKARRGIQTIYGSPKQQKEFEDLADESENQLTVFGQFQPEFASESYLPLMGSAENFISQELPAVASEDMKNQQRWWRDYSKQYENIARHELFGSALTAAEIAAWKKANVSPNSSPDQVKDAMGTLTYLTRKLAEKSKANAQIKDRDPEYINNNYGYLDNYSPFVDLSVVPEGIPMNEWEELTYGERQEALEMIREEQEALAGGGQ